jgi:hypothetical protein
MHKNRIKKMVRVTQEQRKKYKYKIRPDDLEYIIELANDHPKWSVDKIFTEALKPKMRTCVILGLTPKLKKALEEASRVYQMNQTSVAFHALKEFLKARGFCGKD